MSPLSSRASSSTRSTPPAPSATTSLVGSSTLSPRRPGTVAARVDPTVQPLVAAPDTRPENAALPAPPLAANGVSPRARHPALWFIALYGGGVLATLVVASVFHVLVFAAS